MHLNCEETEEAWAEMGFESENKKKQREVFSASLVALLAHSYTVIAAAEIKLAVPKSSIPILIRQL